jgi:hypothetical protein
MKELDHAHELEKIRTESQLRLDEGSAKAADEMRITVIKGQEDRKTTGHAVVQEKNRLQNLRDLGVSPDTISELGTKSGSTDLRFRTRAPEAASPQDFSEAPAPTPGTGAKSRGATLNEHFGADTGVTPAGSAKPAAAAPTLTTPAVTPTAAPAPATPTIPTVKPTSAPSTAGSTNNYEDSKVGKPCTFCGETIEHSYDASVNHSLLPNGWCQHAFSAVNGGGAWDTDKDK